MRVLLIYPDADRLSVIPKKLINIEPLGLEYLAGAIPNHDVKILDMKLENNWERVIEDYMPDVVGISGSVIHVHRMLTVLRKVKEINPLAMTVVGGVHATLMPSDFNKPYIDIIVIGHRPDSFAQAVNNFEQNISMEDIEGLAIRSDGKLHYTSIKSPVTNLDHLPMPRRDLTSHNRHRYFHLVWRPTALIITSAGCSYQCNFCPCPVLTKRRYLKRSPKLVVEELSQIKEEYIYAGDDNLFFDYQHTLDIYSLIKSRNINKKYYILSRVDEINRHPDLVEKWAEIGLKKVFLGLESSNNEDLKSLNKKSTVENNNRAIDILHENNVDPLGAFIIRPEYTKKDFEEILRYMDKMKIYYHEFTILTPFPGTEFHEKMKDKLMYDDTRLYDLAHSILPTKLGTKEFYDSFSQLYRKASSLGRALRIKPAVSPFKRLRFLRLIPGLFDLTHSAKKAYGNLNKMV